jgi:TetR/AcrR family transcriptional regulator, cholesterol catabolism regulator
MNVRARRPVAPSGTKSAATRSRILDAAAKVLSQQGYTAARLTDVGEVAGVQGTAIYYYFSSKEELVAEVLVAGLVHARGLMLETLEAVGDDPLERLRAAVAAHVTMASDRVEYTTAAAMRESGEMPATVNLRCRPDERAYARIWKGLLRDAQETGVLRADLDLAIAQHMIIGALNAINFHARPGRAATEAAVQTALNVLLEGMCARTPEPRGPVDIREVVSPRLG